MITLGVMSKEVRMCVSIENNIHGCNVNILISINVHCNIVVGC